MTITFVRSGSITAKLLPLILLGMLYTQVFSLRVSSKTQGLSALDTSLEATLESALEATFGSSLDLTLESSSSTSNMALNSTPISFFSCSGPIQETGWSYSAGFKTISCGGSTWVGVYAKGNSITSPQFSVGAHRGIVVRLSVAYVDSWDSGEYFKVKADGVEVFSRAKTYNGATPTHTCKSSKWNDAYETVTFGFNHVASTLTLVITSNLNDGIDDESWGICNLTIRTSEYPVSPSGVPLTLAVSEASSTIFFACSSPPNEIGWTYSAGYTKISCAGDTYLGRYAKGATVTSPYFLLSNEHQGIIVSFKLAWIDSWDSGEYFKVTADGSEVFSKVKTYSPDVTAKHHCGNKDWKEAYETVTFGFNHTASSLVFVFSSNLNDGIDDESWGICDFKFTVSEYPVILDGSSTVNTSGEPPAPSLGYSLSSVFPSSLNLGCLDISAVANSLTSAVSTLANAGSQTKSIIDGTITTIVNGLLSSDLTGDIASSSVCVGNFNGSYITDEIDACSAMLLPEDAHFSVISFTLPIPGGVCAAQPGIEIASFCVAMGKYNDLPSLSIQANAGAISCLATAAGSGIGYAIGTALSAGLDEVSVGVSLTSSFQAKTKLFTGRRVEDVEILGNYYDYVSLSLGPESFGLPDVFEISGSATRMVKVVDNAATWISKLNNAQNIQDVATGLFGDISFLAVYEADLKLKLSGKTGGLLPDLGPYKLGKGTIYATTFLSTLESGQALKPGVYTYVTSTNLLPLVISDILSSILKKTGGVLNTVLRPFGLSISDIIRKITPDPDEASERNAFGFMVNTDEIGILVKTTVSGISPLIPSNSKISLQCTFKYSGSKFSCKLDLGSLSKIFTAVISGATWVIKQAVELFDETGKAIAFVDKQLSAFTDAALDTTAANIKKGLIVVAGYASEAAEWAEKTECGYQMVEDAILCGTGTVTDSVLCGSDYITDAAKCGADAVSDAARCAAGYVTNGVNCGVAAITDATKCGFDTVADGAKCGFDMVKSCVKNIFKGKFKCDLKKKAKKCKIPKSCNIEVSCEPPPTCSIAKSCDWPKTCTIPLKCPISKC